MTQTDSLPGEAGLTPIVEEGRNCWKITHASRAAVIIDAAPYFRFIRDIFAQARKQILILGWDFDTRTILDPEQGKKSEALGEFFLRLAKERTDRRIDILKWSFGAKKQFLHLSSAWMLLRWSITRAINFRFDSAHPFGCSHHQKIVVVDEVLAVCGGIDMCTGRWDTSEHVEGDSRRKLPSGKDYKPWHDVTMLMSGGPARQLADLGRTRWKVATHHDLTRVEPGDAGMWPEGLEADFGPVDIAIARTRAPYAGQEEIREIEALYLAMVKAAKRFAYIENQYFTSGKVAAAIAERLQEENPPEFVLVMPRTADGWLEQKAMDGARIRLARRIAKVDAKKRFRIYVPVTSGRSDIYVHAKVSVIDDRLLRVGSSNLNNRSLGLDSECDVIIDAGLAANKGCETKIGEIRTRLIAEHLNISEEEFAAYFKNNASLIGAIEHFRGAGKTLDLLDLTKPSDLDKLIADSELLDPEHVSDILEPLGNHGLWKYWQGGTKMRDRYRERRYHWQHRKDRREAKA